MANIIALLAKTIFKTSLKKYRFYRWNGDFLDIVYSNIHDLNI